MEFKNAVSILTTKFGTVYRTLLFVFIVLLLVLAIASCFFVPTRNSLLKNEEIISISDDIQTEIDSFMDGEKTLGAIIATVKEDVTRLYNYIRYDTNALGIMVVMLIVALVLYRFCTSLCFVTISDIYSQFMQSNLKYGFMSNYFKNLGKNVRYSLGYTLFTVITDLIIIFLSAGFVLLTVQYLGFVSVSIAIVLIIGLTSLRMTLMSGVLPYMVLEGKKNFFTALQASLPMVKRNMSGYMRCIVLTMVLYFTINAVAAVPTFGLASILSISMLISMSRILELCFYYKDKKARYYVDQNTIVDTLPLAERKDLEINI